MKLAIFIIEKSTHEDFSNPRTEIQYLFCSRQKVTARSCPVADCIHMKWIAIWDPQRTQQELTQQIS